MNNVIFISLFLIMCGFQMPQIFFSPLVFISNLNALNDFMHYNQRNCPYGNNYYTIWAILLYGILEKSACKNVPRVLEKIIYSIILGGYQNKLFISFKIFCMLNHFCPHDLPIVNRCMFKCLPIMVDSYIPSFSVVNYFLYVF